MAGKSTSSVSSTTPIAAGDLLNNAVKPALLKFGVTDPAFEHLLMGTAAHESHLMYTRQLGNGPARGYFQMEPATHDDCWINFLKYHPLLITVIQSINPAGKVGAADLMVTDPFYAAAMAYIRYVRVHRPVVDSLQGLSQFWKDFYNTPLGAGTTAQFLADWQKYLAALYPAVH